MRDGSSTRLVYAASAMAVLYVGVVAALAIGVGYGLYVVLHTLFWMFGAVS